MMVTTSPIDQHRVIVLVVNAVAVSMHPVTSLAVREPAPRLMAFILLELLSSSMGTLVTWVFTWVCTLN